MLHRANVATRRAVLQRAAPCCKASQRGRCPKHESGGSAQPAFGALHGNCSCTVSAARFRWAAAAVSNLRLRAAAQVAAEAEREPRDGDDEDERADDAADDDVRAVPEDEAAHGVVGLQ